MSPRYDGKMLRWPNIALLLFLPGTAASLPQSDATGSLACRTWEYAAAQLTANEQRVLQEEGAVYAGRLVLSAELVADCLARLEIAGYLERAVQERPHAGDGRVAARHSRLIVEVARRLWTGSAMAAAESGAHGRYNLLAGPDLAAADVGPLAAEVLARESFAPDLVWALLQRPLPQTRDPLREHLKVAEETHNVHDQIYALALLYHIGERSALGQLRRLRSSDQLSAFEREFLPRLLARLERGARLTFPDLDPREMYNER
jgi:hypothetical protein